MCYLAACSTLSAVPSKHRRPFCYEERIIQIRQNKLAAVEWDEVLQLRLSLSWKHKVYHVN